MLHSIFIGDNKPVDLNNSMPLIAAIVMAVIGPEVFIVQPGFVLGMVEYMGFSEKMAGDISSAEMWGIALTTVLMTFSAHRFNWRHVFFASLLIMIIGNIASIFADTPLLFGLWRFFTGIGAGGLVSLSFTVVGLTDKPDRNFGYMIMWVLVYGAIVLMAMPAAYQLIGMNGVLLFLALLPACGLGFVRYLPTSGTEHVQVEADAVNLPSNYKYVALLAMFCYFLGQGVVWAYLFLIGITGGGTEQEIANGLTASQFLGVAGALTAAMLGSKLGRSVPLSIGILGTFIPLFWLFGSMGALIYGIAVCVYNYFWNLTHPFLLSAMASFDRSGRVVTYAVAAQMLGIANGPWIAARVFTEGDFSNVIWLGIALFSISLMLILPPVLKQHKLAQQTQR
jgi:predicted MFS family arabinose efflux permease